MGYLVSDSPVYILGFELLEYFSFAHHLCNSLTKRMRVTFSLGFLWVGMNSCGFFLSCDLISQQFPSHHCGAFRYKNLTAKCEDLM